MRKKKALVPVSLIFFCLLPLRDCPGQGARIEVSEQAPPEAQSAMPSQAPVFVGEFFGVPVPEDNYFFVQGAISVFGNKWGRRPTTREEWENAIWDQLLLSYEAFRRGIMVSREEIEAEVSKMLKAEKVDFDWKTDKEAYEEWIKDKADEPSSLFENQMMHLLQIQKLHEHIMDGIDPPVSEKEAYQEFLNEHNNLSLELIRFDEREDAERFYTKARRNKKFWDQEREARPGDFKGPGGMSIEAWVDLWKVPIKDCYKMLKMKSGSIYPPIVILEGRYAVFRIHGTREADESLYSKRKEGYYNQIRRRKQFDGLAKWFGDLKRQANIKKYKKEDEGS